MFQQSFFSIAIVVKPDNNHCKKYPYFTKFLVYTFLGKAQFPHISEWLTRTNAEIVPFHNIPTPENKVKLRYFSHWKFFCWSKVSFVIFVSQSLNYFSLSEWIRIKCIKNNICKEREKQKGRKKSCKNSFHWEFL